MKERAAKIEQLFAERELVAVHQLGPEGHFPIGCVFEFSAVRRRPLGENGFQVRAGKAGFVFLHRLVPGGCDHSYGIQVARLAGMPPELIARAKEVLSRLEQNDLSLTRSAVRRSRRLKADDGRDQISLFAQRDRVPEHPVLKDLRSLDTARMTPLEALVKLDAWKRQVASGEGDGEAKTET